MKLGLCQGRHPMPVENYIFGESVNPLDVDGLEKEAVTELLEFGKLKHIDLYVSGLTVALIAALNACRQLSIAVTLYHFDRDSGTYYPQEVKNCAS